MTWICVTISLIFVNLKLSIRNYNSGFDLRSDFDHVCSSTS